MKKMSFEVGYNRGRHYNTNAVIAKQKYQI